MTTRQEQIDAQLRERQVVSAERQAMALERIADSLDRIDGRLESLCNYVDDTGDRLVENLVTIATAADRAHPDPAER